MSTEAELAWAAGIFEGEGWVHVSKYTFRLGVEMADLDVLERLQEYLGGMVAGPRSRGENRRPMWTWKSPNGPPTLELVVRFQPWLGARRRSQLEQAAEQWNHRLDHRPRELPCAYCGKPVPQRTRGTLRKTCGPVCYSRSRDGTPKCRGCGAELPAYERKRYCQVCREKDVRGERRREYQREWCRARR